MIFLKINSDSRVSGVRASAEYAEADKDNDEIIFSGSKGEAKALVGKIYANGNFIEDEIFLANVSAKNMPEPKSPKAVTVPTFKLLFTSAERVSIKQSTDPTVQDFYDLIQDPRVTTVDTSNESVRDSIMYLEAVAQILQAGRAQEILDACME